jgi:hypothetical protein
MIQKALLIFAGVFFLSLSLCPSVPAGLLDGTCWTTINVNGALLTIGFYDDHMYLSIGPDPIFILPRYFKYKSVRNLRGSINFINLEYIIFYSMLTWGQGSIEEGQLRVKMFDVYLLDEEVFTYKDQGYFMLQTTNWKPD